MNIITHTFLHKQKLRLFIYDVNQEEGGHENLGNFANSWGYCLFFFGGGGGGVERPSFFPSYAKFFFTVQCCLSISPENTGFLGGRDKQQLPVMV